MPRSRCTGAAVEREIESVDSKITVNICCFFFALRAEYFFPPPYGGLKNTYLWLPEKPHLFPCISCGVLFFPQMQASPLVPAWKMVCFPLLFCQTLKV